MVGDHVVQLACDPGALLDDRLARGHVAFALGDPGAPLAVADDAADEQHHHRLTTANGTALVHVRLRPGDGGKVDRDDERRTRERSGVAASRPRARTARRRSRWAR